MVGEVPKADGRAGALKLLQLQSLECLRRKREWSGSKILRFRTDQEVLTAVARQIVYLDGQMSVWSSPLE